MSKTLTAALDHVVVHVAQALDEAQATYTKLGFRLQPRGHHSLGSSNHLAVFGDTYLELLGHEPGRVAQRKDLWQTPIGLTGLVFKTADADAVYAQLQSLGIEGDAPRAFDRPVTLPDGSQSPAQFRTVHLQPALVPHHRVFFCEQRTPELVWIDAWRTHPNQVTEIVEFVITSRDPQHSSEPLQRLFEGTARTGGDGTVTLPAGKAQVRFLPWAQAKAQYPDAAQPEHDGLRMIALTFKTASLPAVREVLAQAGIRAQHDDANRIVVAAKEAFGVTLQFVEGDA